MLWHKHSSYISRERMQSLIKEGVLHDLDFLNFDTCIDCIKGKLPSELERERDEENKTFWS